MQNFSSKLGEDGVKATFTRRGWRFYGSFACLALLNLVCAIDATVLSVALPVRNVKMLLPILAIL